MNYYFSRILAGSFDAAIQRITEELHKEGFGILSEIDVKATLKKKLDVDFRSYRILGACNPPFACQALQAEDKIGPLFLNSAGTVILVEEMGVGRGGKSP